MTPMTTAASARRARQVAWRRKGWILLPPLLMALAALSILSLQSPVFDATAVLYIRPLDAERLFSDSPPGPSLDPRVLSTEAALVLSEEAKRVVEGSLGFPTTASVDLQPGADLLELTARASTAERAARVANRYVEVYRQARRERAMIAWRIQQGRVRESVSQLQTSLDALPAVGGDELGPADSNQLRRAVLVAERDALLAQVDQLRINESLQGDNVEFVSPALEVSATPGIRRNSPIAASAAVGLILGLGLGSLRERCDRRVRTEDDLDRLDLSVPTVGVVPVDRRLARGEMLAPGDVSTTANVFRRVRAFLAASAPNGPALRIDVVGATTGQGCTTVARHLALSFARSGRSVVLIERDDIDLASAVLHGPQGGGDGLALLPAVRGTTKLFVRPTIQERLDVLSLHSPTNDGGWPMASRHLVERLRELRACYDVVIVDCSSILTSPGALRWERADLTVIVARLGHLHAEELCRAVARLRTAGARLVGIVVNEGRLDDLGYRR